MLNSSKNAKIEQRKEKKPMIIEEVIEKKRLERDTVGNIEEIERKLEEMHKSENVFKKSKTTKS
jgi:hypothetical protein